MCVKTIISKLYVDNFHYLSCHHIVDNKKCKKKVIQTSPNTFRCPKCSIDIFECDFCYLLKIDLQDETGELIKVTKFEGPTNAFVGCWH